MQSRASAFAYPPTWHNNNIRLFMYTYTAYPYAGVARRKLRRASGRGVARIICCFNKLHPSSLRIQCRFASTSASVRFAHAARARVFEPRAPWPPRPIANIHAVRPRRARGMAHCQNTQTPPQPQFSHSPFAKSTNLSNYIFPSAAPIIRMAAHTLMYYMRAMAVHTHTRTPIMCIRIKMPIVILT